MTAEERATLLAEIERLKAALKTFAALAWKREDDHEYVTLEVTLGDCRRARAALNPAESGTPTGFPFDGQGEKQGDSH